MKENIAFKNTSDIQDFEGRTFVASNSRHVDPFVMALNHGETFGVFDRQGDIVNLGRKLQGIFFEGCRHLSLVDFQLNKGKPLLLSSVIREDNDSLSVDMSNEGCGEFKEATIHIKKSIQILNEAFSETVVFKNFNSKRISLTCCVNFDSGFKDVFELRGFNCEQSPQKVKKQIEKDQMSFTHIGRDKVHRITTISCNDEQAKFGQKGFHVDVEIEPNESAEVSFLARFSRFVPEEKESLFEGELERKELSLKKIKALLPAIKTSNEYFNHWINRSSLDLTTLMSYYGNNLYPMAGVPWYNTPFGRDGLITAIQTLSVAPFIAKNVLLFLADYQSQEEDSVSDSEPGKILHELRKGELANIGALPFKKYYGAVDSTFLFLWLAGIYLKRSGDKETIAKIWPAIEKALDWSKNYADLDGDGFYEYKKRNPKGLDNQCWKDSPDSISHQDGTLAEPPLALVEVQGYAYEAFSMAGYLFEQRGELKNAQEWRNKAEKLKLKFNEKFWIEELGFYALALDKNKSPCKVLSSNPGHCMATGIMDSSKARQVGERLLESDLFSGWGIRTLAKNEKRYNPMSYHNGSIWPHDNSLIASGLKRYKQDENLHKLAQTLFDTAMEMDMARLPELFCGFDRVPNESPTLYPVSCSPQAWATGVVFILLESMLGMKVQALKSKITFESPSLPEFLDWIDIHKLPLHSDEKISFSIKRAAGKDATVEILERPKGWKISINK